MNFKQFLFIEKTYLKNLKKISEGAVAKIKASDIVYKPSKKFQIPRKDMPQVKSEDFNDLLKFFEKDGVRITNDRENISKIIPIQKDIVRKKVLQLFSSNTKKLRKPLLISQDNHLLDGHHRHAALKLLDENEVVPVIRVHLPVKKALKEIMNFPKVTFKTMTNREFRK